ncbi:enoyl-CoA hydratase [Xenophilus sp. Marseille-Q4582]|uniref:enoyl-CoA hydratase n=1 Tax=Xenophilus sp. Marseille-Q4582 TaxID=2866600 RepID=UPI001CE4A57E|nr:enoyl-CoA hydratase [Xenophilus sp. Marseille-Q4582]
MEEPPVLLETRDARGVVTLTLNRPQAFNALSEALIDALHRTADRLAADETLRAVVIAGAGKAFCAGHDLRQMRATPSQAYYAELFARCSAMMRALHQLPVPVIARVHGIATAAGCQLVALCDLAVAARDARFATSGIDVGLFCATPSVTLSRNVSRKAAFEMLVTGDFIDADTARERGLVNRVATPEHIDAEVQALLARILDKPRIALEMGKALFYRQLEAGLDAALDDAGRTMACNMAHETALEGVQAFLDKRPPAWR